MSGVLMKRLAEAREKRDVGLLADAIPYARWMQIAPENGTGELLTRMRYHDELIGNTFLPAIHGGTLGAMLEMTAIFHLLWETQTPTVPKIVNITVDYLRSAGGRERKRDLAPDAPAGAGDQRDRPGQVKLDAHATPQ